MEPANDPLIRRLEAAAASLEGERYPGDLAADVRARIDREARGGRVLRFSAFLAASAAAAALALALLRPFAPPPAAPPAPRAAAPARRAGFPTRFPSPSLVSLPRPALRLPGRSVASLPSASSLGSALGRARGRIRPAPALPAGLLRLPRPGNPASSFVPDFEAQQKGDIG